MTNSLERGGMDLANIQGKNKAAENRKTDHKAEWLKTGCWSDIRKILTPQLVKTLAEILAVAIQSKKQLAQLSTAIASWERLSVSLWNVTKISAGEITQWQR
ncbi:hypothetical protein [Lyngbya aestuarii]|uniref:hypothetical protein n=1 Tax=Lyngbya aestuarii TaxID=118322 RepID=UPI00403D6DB9